MQRKWNAKWIWGQQKNEERNLFYYFRKSFELTESPSDIKIYITAETKYKLYINGEYVSFGSLQSQPYYKYYDVVDATSYLKPGKNTIAVHAYYLGTIPDMIPGLLLEAVDGNGNVLVNSDETFKAKKDESRRQDTHFAWYNQVTPFQEHHDARNAPVGWTLPDYDDSNWEGAEVYSNRRRQSSHATLSGPWSNLIERDIPYMQVTDILPVSIVKTEEHIGIYSRFRNDDLTANLSASGKPLEFSSVVDVENLLGVDGTTLFQTSKNHLDKVFDGYYNPSITLDFGKVITAGIKLELTAKAGQIISIGYAERLIDGQFNNAIEGSFADQYITRDGDQSFESFTWKGFRYVKILFRKCFEGVTIKNVKAAVTMYPYEEKGVFKSENQMLNSVYDICQYTIRLCSNECITDTPFREQGQWLGDVSAVTLGAIYACFGDTMLTEKFLKQSGANQMPTGLLTNMTNTTSFDWQNIIPDYSLWWVMAVWNHYMYTGKEEILHDNYVTIIKIIDAFTPYIDEFGMIANMPYWLFIDWAYIDKDGECSSLNAIYYGAIQALLKIAKLRKDHYVIEKYQANAKPIKDGFTNRFFNEKIGLFVDANKQGSLSARVSEHANVAAIYFDLCTEEVTKKVIENLYLNNQVEFIEAQPFFTTFALQALKKVGQMDLALDIILDRWGERMIGTGAKSCYEEWYQNGSWRDGDFNGFMRTHSHAWSAHPAEFLIKDLAGIEILEPGCKKLRVTPYQGSFDYNVKYPTPLGTVVITYKEGKVTITKPDEIKI